MPIALATYRLQLHRGFTLDDAAGIADYLVKLGVSHVYSSPILQSVAGSTHGYDVVDHHRVNTELGGEEGLYRLSKVLQAQGLGLMLDIVPNHMAITGRENVWWWDVLEDGPASRYAFYFDVEWGSPEKKLHNVVLLPVLGDHYGRVLDAREIKLVREGAAFMVRYHDHAFPVSPRSLDQLVARAGERCDSDELAFIADALSRLPSSWETDSLRLKRRHRDKRILRDLFAQYLDEHPDCVAALDSMTDEINGNPDALHALLERQNYRLTFWRTARQDTGYRRFFDITTLIGLRAEDEQVLADTHELVWRWIGEGIVDSIRVDHPDGLRDPHEYFQRLRERVPGGWIVAEKIVTSRECLPGTWPIAGTTGYDFLNQVGGLFIDPVGEGPFTQLYRELTGESGDFSEVVRDKKLQVLRQVLGGDLNLLTSLLADVCEQHRRHRDYTRQELYEALREVLADFSVYRTYVRPATGQVGEADRRYVTLAIREAQRHRPDLDPFLFGFIGEILLLEASGPVEEEFVSRFQQVTGPVMAKGAEDTAFYCYNRLLSLNEVGGDPARFGVEVKDFHAWCDEIQRHWPRTLLATSTHDTKRSEDVRSRISLLSEIPYEWAETVHQWFLRNMPHWNGRPPDRNLEYFLYQSLVGAWPLELDRAWKYLEKSMREAKQHTSWIDPHPTYEETVRTFLHRLYDDQSFLAEMGTLVERLLEPGYINSLAQTLIKLTAPGIPDFYQGMELWNFSLVDPDNRRPVDYDLRRRLLRDMERLSPEEIWRRRAEGLPKLWIIRQALRVRHEHPEQFGPRGGYRPLSAQGAKCDHVIAFMRGHAVITITPRLVLGLKGQWADTILQLPSGMWRNELDGRQMSGRCALQELLGTLPLGLLVRMQEAA
ncbi:MAG: malto-oligosyltrehalose synthase [Nitrospiraceae bacterium]